jgi:hypothetical protein
MDKQKTLPHHGAGCLRWRWILVVLQLRRRRGKLSASSFLMATSHGLGDDLSRVSSPKGLSRSRSSLPWWLWGTRWRLWWMAASPRDLGSTYLTPKKGGREPAPERVGPIQPGRPAWALSGRFAPVLLLAAHLDNFHLAPFICVIFRSSSPRSR